ncbi:hypothetical protein PVAP13_9NG558614 [Panicum virgatum]|uniref:Uncharacterized protein n=1 Tax=Panicum virgatum TaxID=38727 RepID=A0A8T0MU17_PANVG|nr:hypothetical protein PVAP13_9NG558614 [Panicum virgatum]
MAAWHRGPGVAAIHGILLCGGSGIPSSGRLATLTMLLLDDAGGALAGEAEACPREPAPTLLIGLPRPASTLLIGLPRWRRHLEPSRRRRCPCCLLRPAT